MQNLISANTQQLRMAKAFAQNNAIIWRAALAITGPLTDARKRLA